MNRYLYIASMTSRKRETMYKISIEVFATIATLFCSQKYFYEGL